MCHLLWALFVIRVRLSITHLSKVRRCRRLVKRLQGLHLFLDQRCNRRKCFLSHRGSEMYGSDRRAAVIGDDLIKNLDERRVRRNATNALSHQDVFPAGTAQERSNQTRFLKGGTMNESNPG